MNIKKNYLFLTITIFTLIAGFLRFFEITQNPVSLNTDEVTFAYNAYSILKTGRDEYGEFMPITFKSVGDYKNPVPVYILVPSIAIFGLNEFGVRFPFALFGTLAPLLFFLLTFELTKNKKIALLTAVLTVISPWHLFYSRFGSDPQMAMIIVTLGFLFFLKINESKIYSLLAAFFLSLSMYTYYIERIFVPLLIFVSLIILYKNKNSLSINFKNSRIVIFLATAILLTIPLFLRSFFGHDLARGNMVFINKDIDFIRYITVDHVSADFGEHFALIFLIIKRYLNYFQPDFLFFNGLNMTHLGSLGLGILYLFELPLLILGIWELIKTKKIRKSIVFTWLALSFLPAAFTNNEQNPSRTIIALPTVMLLCGSGLYKFIHIISKFKSHTFRVGVYSFCILVVLLTLVHAFLVFKVHFPLDRSEFSFEGNKETTLYAIQNRDLYKEIVFDPIRGIYAPDIYGLPHAYVLFYSGYDPKTYQKENKDKNGIFGFDKYRVRKIFWPEDQKKEGVLFIGSPWSLPQKDLKEEEILKKIYLSNGDLALLIVTPKPNLGHKN